MLYVGSGEKPLAVSVDRFLRSVHMVQDDVQDGTIFDPLLRAAQEVVETATGCPIGVAEYEFRAAFGFWRRWWFPCCPVESLVSLVLIDARGQELSQDLTGARIAFGSTEPQLVLQEDWPGLAVDASEVVIRARVGSDPLHSSVQPLRQAITLQAKEWFDAGFALGDDVSPPRLSFGVHRLIRQRRYRRPAVYADG